MKEEHTRYYLTMIENEFGKVFLGKALNAVKMHVEYIRSLGKPSNVEKLYNEFYEKE
jgi:hypothetical protein